MIEPTFEEITDRAKLLFEERGVGGGLVWGALDQSTRNYYLALARYRLLAERTA